MRSRVAVGCVVVAAWVASCGGDASAEVHAEGVRVTANLPLAVHGVGSGIDRRAGADDAFWMVSDRGTIVGAHVEDGAMVVDATIPLSEKIDAEEVRALPGGGFLVADERGPSVVAVSPLGVILSRFTPPGLGSVRHNRGFEGLALSGDAKTAYAVMQSPMGNAADPRFAGSRVVRIVRLDVSDPANMSETGCFVTMATELGPSQAGAMKITAAAWLSDDRLLLLEHGADAAKVVVADLRGATNVAATALERSLDLEDVTQGPARLGVTPASTSDAWASASTPEIRTRKLEGLALLDDATIALSDDDDFAAEPGHVWTIGLAAPL